jgi:carbamoyltransferase
VDIIGLHSGHNAAAALVRDGALAFAIQEERLTRIKNQGGLPALALREILNHSSGLNSNGHGLRIASSGKALIRTTWRRKEQIQDYGVTAPNLVDRIKGTVRKSEILSELIDRMRTEQIRKNLRSLLTISSLEINRLEHHCCHAAAAYFGWGKTDEKVLVITCDGSGDGVCASVNVGYKGKIERLAEVEQTHSIGRLYANVTFLLGMVPLEHEYKLMGLAPYAEKSGEAIAIAETLEKLFVLEPKNPLVWRRNGCGPMQYACETLAELFKRKRFDHVAGGLQIFVEKFLVRWIRNCIRETGISKVALSGGVFMNVKANQKILEIPELDELFIFPSCGDETNAIGSAWLLYQQMSARQPRALEQFYLGNEVANDQVETTLQHHQFQNKVKITQVKDIEKDVAGLLARNEIVARFQGRMEFGARALGNRSILANPANANSVRIINEMIKCRDFWMPFAPSVLEERAGDYFVKPKPMKAPYMIITFDTRENKRDSFSAAIHPYDFTGRPQEVNEAWNPRYYRLLKYFECLTGEGIILNTSFNLHGEPVVCSPDDALRVFDISGLKHLAIEDFLLTKT